MTVEIRHDCWKKKRERKYKEENKDHTQRQYQYENFPLF